jgi:hypothetical protein
MMRYDPQGNGAAPADPWVRRGRSKESLNRLAIQAAKAEAAGFGHGVSVTSPQANQVLARNPSDAVEATRRAFAEAGFEVRYTPTNNDSDHHTVTFPKPLTEEWVEKFNATLGVFEENETNHGMGKQTSLGARGTMDR